MPYYAYSQNNSFGRWEGPVGVVVEADTPGQADALAETAGVYFDGCEDGRDCPCCGDRWNRAFVYGRASATEAEAVKRCWASSASEVTVVRRDGTINPPPASPVN